MTPGHHLTWGFMLEWYADLNRWAKFGVAFIFLGLGAAEFFFANRFRPWTWGMGVALLFLAMFIGPSDSEKKGYHF